MIFFIVSGSPRCDLVSSISVESPIEYPANLFCQVDANPVDQLNIYWQTPHNVLLSRNGRLVHVDQDKLDYGKQLFDGDKYDLDQFDLDYDEDKPRKNVYNKVVVATKGTRSRLTVVPHSSADFGIYKCWAENSIGSNRAEPCVFNLTNNHQQTVPSPVFNCNVTFALKVLTIGCDHHTVAGKQFNTKKFHLVLNELDDVGSIQRHSVANKTNTNEPVFVLNNVKANTVYQAIVFVSNLFGHSDKVSEVYCAWIDR